MTLFRPGQSPPHVTIPATTCRGSKNNIWRGPARIHCRYFCLTVSEFPSIMMTSKHVSSVETVFDNRDIKGESSSAFLDGSQSERWGSFMKSACILRFCLVERRPVTLSSAETSQSWRLGAEILRKRDPRTLRPDLPQPPVAPAPMADFSRSRRNDG